jgi:TfoX/Sxy family transcriptional regulator of competence genes
VAYDEALAARIRALLAGDDDVTEKKMFGGLAFLVGGNMSVSVSGQGGLLLRCEPRQTADLEREPHTSTAVMRGRAMEGWLRVAPEGVQTDDELQEWVTRGVSYARSLPPKG